jgi:hypothetical protein
LEEKLLFLDEPKLSDQNIFSPFEKIANTFEHKTSELVDASGSTLTTFTNFRHSQNMQMDLGIM